MWKATQSYSLATSTKNLKDNANKSGYYIIDYSTKIRWFDFYRNHIFCLDSSWICTLHWHKIKQLNFAFNILTTPRLLTHLYSFHVFSWCLYHLLFSLTDEVSTLFQTHITLIKTLSLKSKLLKCVNSFYPVSIFKLIKNNTLLLLQKYLERKCVISFTATQKFSKLLLAKSIPAEGLLPLLLFTVSERSTSLQWHYFLWTNGQRTFLCNITSETTLHAQLTIILLVHFYPAKVNYLYLYKYII